jgi:type IV pilus assembly protein PilW
MHHPKFKSPAQGAQRQAGMTLVEFMISIVIGMLMIAALATLIANQSSNRSEIDRSGRMIENGRYAVQAMATDIQLAGYWGELTAPPDVPGGLPDPCSVMPANLEAAMGVDIQGYDGPATLPAALAACVTNFKSGTDVLVVRRVEPDTSAVENAAGDIDLSMVVVGQAYLQTGLDAGGQLLAVLAIAGADPAANAAAFALKKKDKVKLASLRKMVVDIYYISQCSVPVAGSCTSADGGTPIPTLKRVELGVAAGAAAFTTVTLAEGIENLQIDYGLDTDSDGSPNGDYVNGSAFGVNDWPNVMSLRIQLLARSGEKSPGFTDLKKYVMGTASPFSPAAGEEGYKRHVFVQSVRLVNPSIRRMP